jgi:hypothetical protein
MPKSTRPKPIIVCLTSSDDEHPDYVRPHLHSEMIIVHGLAAKESGHLSYSFKDGETAILQDGRQITNVKSVWYRKPKIYQEYVRVPQGYGRYAWSALKGHFDFIMPMLNDAFWVSDYDAIRRASSKPWQLQKASAVGFNVPETLFTSDHRSADDFLAAHHQAIVKSPAVWGLEKDNEVLHFPTTRITPGKQLKLEGLHLAPAIFQEVIEPKVELRVTVVGDKVFAASIQDSPLQGLPEAVRDWRVGYAHGATVFDAYDLPKKVAKQCILLVRDLGLQYGAMVFY